MDTKKFNAKGQGLAKAGRDNTKVILTAAGVAAAAAGVAAAAHVFSGKQEEESVENLEEVTPQEEPMVENEEQKQEVEQNIDTTLEAENTVDGGDISQPQPTTGNASPSSSSQEPTSVTDAETAQEVAEAIAHAEEIDNNDIDAPAMVEIDRFTSAFDENGNEIAAVEVHSQDGTPFLLADMDNDGVYESMFDTDGNFVAHTEANLTHSDLEAMMDQTGGFLAINEQDHTNLSEDPTNDIIDTETGTHPGMAMNEASTPEATDATTNTAEQDVAQEPSADDIDNLLAELLGDNTDSESKGIDEEVLVDEYGSSDDELVDDDDSNDDGLEDDVDDDI